MRTKLFTSVLLGLLAVTSVFAKASEPFRVAILMFDDVQIIDFAAPYEVFGHANFKVFTVSPNGKSVTTAMGLRVTPDHSFASMPAADAIVVPGGNVGDAMQDKRILTWLNRQQANTDHILSVCTGSHILAESGLLDGQGATTFHRALDDFEEDYPAIEVLREHRFVDNGQIITSAGLSSGIDASLHLVSKVHGLARAKTIALHLEYDWQPEGGFVRAMMADRMMPDNDYDWPKNTHFDRLSAYGDRSVWQITYAATSPVDLNTLIGVYQQAMLGNDDWQASPSAQDKSLQWLGKNNAQGWLHTLQFAEQESDNTYRLQVTVQQTNG